VNLQDQLDIAVVMCVHVIVMVIVMVIVNLVRC
jgi:hypothetical protein